MDGCPCSIPGVGRSLLLEQQLQDFRSILRYRHASVYDSIHPDRLSSVYNAYQELLGSDAEELLASAGGDVSGYPWSDSPVETIEAIIDVVQLPENEENIVEDQPTEAVDSDTDDNENQEDFSEEIEDEDTESSLENEDYPGEDVVEIINLRGETTTVYKLVDGRYMDCTNTVYIYDGKDTWTDTNGVEWNQEVI